MSDVERLRRDINLPDLVASYGVKLSRDGDEWIGCCPFHVEDTPSFTVFIGKDRVSRFHCFGCGTRGDVVDFVKEIKGVDTREAIKILGGGRSDRPNVVPARVETIDHYAGIEPISPPLALLRAGKKVDLYNPKRKGDRREWGSFSPAMVHPYHLQDGRLFGYVLRHDLGGGEKETPMVMRVRLPGGRECWARYPFPKPRPLYGLPSIAGKKQVLIVEGEKCADRLRRASGRAVISWAGGTQGVKHSDWSPLAGIDAIIWPDFDVPGFSTACEIARILHGLGCSIRIAGDEA